MEGERREQEEETAPAAPPSSTSEFGLSHHTHGRASGAIVSSAGGAIKVVCF